MIQHHVNAKEKQVQAHVSDNLPAAPAPATPAAPFIGVDGREAGRAGGALLGHAAAPLCRSRDDKGTPGLGRRARSEHQTTRRLQSSTSTSVSGGNIWNANYIIVAANALTGRTT